MNQPLFLDGETFVQREGRETVVITFYKVRDQTIDQLTSGDSESPLNPDLCWWKHTTQPCWHFNKRFDLPLNLMLWKRKSPHSDAAYSLTSPTAGMRVGGAEQGFHSNDWQQPSAHTHTDTRTHTHTHAHTV